MSTDPAKVDATPATPATPFRKWAERTLELMLEKQRSLEIVGFTQALLRKRLPAEHFEALMKNLALQLRAALFRDGRTDMYAICAVVRAATPWAPPQAAVENALRAAEVGCIAALFQLARERALELPDCTHLVPQELLLPPS